MPNSITRHERQQKHNEASRRISDNLRGLESLTQTMPNEAELIKKAIETIESQLRESNFPIDHEFWIRLNRLKPFPIPKQVEQYKIPEKMKNFNPELYKGRRDYWGKCYGHLLRFVANPTEIYLNQVYKSLIKISWGFNLEGRMQFIDLTDFKAGNEITRIMESLSERNLLRWNDAIAHCNDHPALVYVHPNFENYNLPERVSRLVYYGHLAARETRDAIEQDHIEEFKFNENRQRGTINLQLRDMKNDEAAMQMLIQAAKFDPRVIFFDKPHLVRLDYTKSARH